MKNTIETWNSTYDTIKSVEANAQRDEKKNETGVCLVILSYVLNKHEEKSVTLNFSKKKWLKMVKQVQESLDALDEKGIEEENNGKYLTCDEVDEILSDKEK